MIILAQGLLVLARVDIHVTVSSLPIIMVANSEKEHLSIVICGHVDSGKSTTTGRLIFELGGLPERELEKLKQEAERLGKGSFAFAFYMELYAFNHGSFLCHGVRSFFSY